MVRENHQIDEFFQRVAAEQTEMAGPGLATRKA
jgi:hypothetical protein